MEKIQTPLAKARGLGAAKTGVHHWWMQRISALALVPLVIWFSYSVVHMAVDVDASLLSLLESPFHAGAMLLFIVIGLYHGAIGMQVVIEDYVHSGCWKYTLLIAVQLVSVVSAVAAVISVFYAHLGGAIG